MLMCSREGGWASSGGLNYIYVNNYNNEGFNLDFRLHNNGACIGRYSPFEPVEGEWYHFVGAFDGKSTDFYSNGAHMSKVACQQGMKETSRTLKIARSEQLGIQWDFIGMVDEVRVYDRALTEAEVKKNFAATGVAVEPSTEKLSLTWGEVKVSE